jgi:D-serine deaminase-like pyridoxal phosphate-dependent protein
MPDKKWYVLNNPDEIDSPALLIYKERVAYNIRTMVQIVGDPKRLAPHVKTHKMAEIVKMQIDAGITTFKCATIAEAEMLSAAGAKHILLAYQLNFTKAKRLIPLIKNYPEIDFSSLVDNLDSAKMLNDLFQKENLKANIFIDVNDGMNRTGITAGEQLIDLFKKIQQMPNVIFHGLHVYDGHIRDADFETRKQNCQKEFEKLNAVKEQIKQVSNLPEVKIIAGGTPTFTVHALNKNVDCSPGTCLLWDYGYNQLLTEQPFEFAAVVFTRIISKPAPGLITTDLGHKSVAAENPIDKRIFFLNLKNYEIKSQSEEHLVIEVADWENMKVGDELYGVPYHICPTVALYDEAVIVGDGNVIDKWNVVARRKRIIY